MHKYLVLLATAAVAVALVLLFSGSAAAAPGDNGNACPPSSPAGGDASPPGCGHPGEQPPPQPPAGNCQSADLVLLTADAKIVCVYFPPNGNLATTDEECPDALIATGPGPAPLNGGVCVFLPPAST
jgi:hypothetical protein